MLFSGYGFNKEKNMSEIIEKYRIQFVIKHLLNEYIKSMHSLSDSLDQFITDYKTVDDINNFLLFEIDKVLSGISENETIISQSMVTVIVHNDISMFYSDPDYSSLYAPELSLPTQDLKAIVEAWLAYIS